MELLEDYYAPEDTGGREALIDKLHELFSYFVPEGLAAQESFKQLVEQNLPLGTLTDTITYALDLPLAIKQQLLAESNVDIRSRILIRCLEQQVKRKKVVMTVTSRQNRSLRSSAKTNRPLRSAPRENRNSHFLLRVSRRKSILIAQGLEN